MKLSKNTSISMLPEEHIQALKTSYINLESADNKLSNFIDKKFITQLENEISSLEKIKKIQQKKQSVASDAALLQKKLEKKKTNFTSKLKKKIETHLDDTISPKIKSIQKILKHIQNSKIHESDIDFLKAHASHIIRDKAEYIVLASTLQLASKSYNDNYKSIQTQINSVTKENKDHNKTYQILKSNLLRTAESGFEQHLFIIEFFQENLHILEDKNSIIQEIIKHGEQDNVIIFEPTIEDALQVLETNGDLINKVLDSDELEIKDVLTKQELEPLTALTKQLEKIYTELYPKTEEAIILDKNAEIIYSKALLEAGGRKKLAESSLVIINTLTKAKDDYTFEGELTFHQKRDTSLNNVANDLSITLSNNASDLKLSGEEKLQELREKAKTIVSNSKNQLYEQFQQNTKLSLSVSTMLVLIMMVMRYSYINKPKDTGINEANKSENTISKTSPTENEKVKRVSREGRHKLPE